MSLHLVFTKPSVHQTAPNGSAAIGNNYCKFSEITNKLKNACAISVITMDLLCSSGFCMDDWPWLQQQGQKIQQETKGSRRIFYF